PAHVGVIDAALDRGIHADLHALRGQAHEQAEGEERVLVERRAEGDRDYRADGQPDRDPRVSADSLGPNRGDDGGEAESYGGGGHERRGVAERGVAGAARVEVVAV